MPGGCAYTGIWNEQSWSVDYVLELRANLDAAGFNATRIIAADGGWDPAPPSCPTALSPTPCMQLGYIIRRAPTALRKP
jgi:hypothetical protein